MAIENRIEKRRTKRRLPPLLPESHGFRDEQAHGRGEYRRLAEKCEILAPLRSLEVQKRYVVEDRLYFITVRAYPFP
jgi:hypothetical protein